MSEVWNDIGKRVQADTPAEKALRKRRVRENALAATEALNRVEVAVPEPGLWKGACEGVGPMDDYWMRVYQGSYRRMLRCGKVVGAPFRFRASVIADYVVWMQMPMVDRPASWPKTKEELAQRHGITVWTLVAWVKQAKAMGWLVRPVVDVAEKLAQVDDALHNRTLVALDKGTKDAAALATAYYKRTGAVQGGSVTNVQIGSNVVVNGVDPAKWLERAKRLIPYVEEGVRDGEVEVVGRDAGDGEDSAGGGREARSGERDGGPKAGGPDERGGARAAGSGPEEGHAGGRVAEVSPEPEA